MRSSIFRKLALAALVIALAGVWAADSLLRRAAAAGRRAETLSRLVSAATTVAAALADRPAPLTRWCAATGESMQLLDSSGRVLAACGAYAAPAGATVTGPDLLAARDAPPGIATAGAGSALRCYVAVPVSAPGAAPRLLRLIAPVAPGPFPGALRWSLLAIAASALALFLATAFLLSRAWNRRLAAVGASLASLLDGPSVPARRPAANDEFAPLQRSIQEVALRLGELFERWRIESSRSEAILSSMAEGVLAVDRDLRVIFCNRAVVRAMGVRAPVRERTPVLEFLRDTELIALLKRVVERGEAVKQTVKIAAAGGHAFEVQAAPFDAAGGTGALAIFYDMTDLERLEQVRKDFVANVSHEMRTPLAAIVGYADTLLDGGLEDPSHNQRFVEIIRGNAIRLNSIASDLLVLSELESGTRPGEPEKVSVLDVLDSALATVESEARNRGILLHRGDCQDAAVLGYRFRLEQALLNLLVNAVKFNRQGGEVRVSALAAPGEIRIAVTDTGVGIPSQDLPRIFERFYRVDKARSRQVGGTGLGLSIVRHVIERMNGRIEVESQLGRGSTFTVVLPTC